MKGVVVNDQIDFRMVKNLDHSAQLQIVINSILQSIARVGDMRRKPKDFDHMRSYETVNGLLHKYFDSLNIA